MADTVDQESREHEATEEKVKLAHERGDTPNAPDMWLFASLVAIGVALMLMKHFVGEELGGKAYRLFALVADIRILTPRDATALWRAALGEIAAPWGLVIFGMFSTAISMAALAHSPRVAWSRLKVDGARLDPIAGTKRILGRMAIFAFSRTVLKMMVAVVIVGSSLSHQWKRLARDPPRQASLIGVQTIDAVLEICMQVVCLAVALAILDILWSRYSWRKKLRMTRQELKDETKRAEGDPLVKLRMRSIALDRARRRMLADVESATMVIVNPTHYAVALRYLREDGGTPTVVAKGQELIALKIRAQAADREIPVIEQPELARAMYRRVEVGDAIPIEFYRAVAEIVNFLSVRQTRTSAIS